MSARGGVILANSSVLGATTTPVVEWIGGRTVCVVNANQYGSTCQLQVQGPAPQGNWIPVCSSFVSDQVFAFDAPQGLYRINNVGSSIALSASLTAISYF